MTERLQQSIANEVIGNRSDETLQRLWGRLPLEDAVATRDMLLEVMPEITQAFGDVAATSSAALYDSTLASAGVAAPPAALPGPIAQEAIEAGVRWSVGPLFGANPDPAQALARMQQTTDRLAIAQSDATLRSNSERDGIRYAWVPSGPTCAFCTRLASYGAVYKTPDINRHAKCNCSIQPVPVSQPIPVKTVGFGDFLSELNRRTALGPNPEDAYQITASPYLQTAFDRLQVERFGDAAMFEAWDDYVGNGYKPINRGMRTGRFGSSARKEQAANLQQAYQRTNTVLPQEQVFRGVQNDLLGPTLTPGDRFVDKGFVSVSESFLAGRDFASAVKEGISRATATQSNSIYVISPSARARLTKVLPGDPAAGEWILPPNSSFRVSQITESTTKGGGKQRIIEIEWEGVADVG